MVLVSVPGSHHTRHVHDVGLGESVRRLQVHSRQVLVPNMGRTQIRFSGQMIFYSVHSHQPTRFILGNRLIKFTQTTAVNG